MITTEQAISAQMVLRGLGAAVRMRRDALGLSKRVAAARIGTSEATLERVEAGLLPNGGHVRAILAWLIETAPALATCSDTYGDYRCTLPPGHGPTDHEAALLTGRVLAAWR
jgi:transcriptional regulator with XRE-family HTH domain